MKKEEKTKDRLMREVKRLSRIVTSLEKKNAGVEETKKALLESESKYRSLVESTDDSIYLVDKSCHYLFMNKKHMSRLCLLKGQVEGLAYSELHTPEETGSFIEKIDSVFATGESSQHEYRSLRDNKYFFQTFSPVKDKKGRIVAVTVVSKDITTLKDMEEKLRALSLTDALTGLYNRRGFQTLIEMQINIADRYKKGIYLLYVDLDDMKKINDTFGHQEGDKALIETAKLLKTNYRKSDIVARIGGDEFVVIPVGSDKDSVELIMSRLRRSIDKFNARGTLGYKLALSAGVAYYDPGNPCSVDELLKQADSSMYEQKKYRRQS